jgi:hypothetical protein
MEQSGITLDVPEQKSFLENISLESQFQNK